MLVGCGPGHLDDRNSRYPRSLAEGRQGGRCRAENPSPDHHGILVGCRLLDVVNDKNVHWPFFRFQFESELFLQCGGD
jgi:hypothetical protein